MGLSDFSGGTPNPPSGNSGIPGSPMGRAMQSMPSMNQGFNPEDILINYNKKYQTSDPALFREKQVHQTMAILIGKNKPNALLIGPAGVGKTKIVEDLARRLATNDPIIPDKLTGSIIYELPLSALISGTSFRGQMEERLEAILNFIKDPKNKAILFIDEIHQLASKNSTHEEIAQMLKPALARGDIRTIGATTLQEANEFMKDPALNRRFSRLIVDEFTREQTIEILKTTKSSFFKHYSNKVLLSDNIMETVALLADEYKPAGSHRPDNAITLLDRSIGDAIINRKIMEDQAKNDPTLLQAIQSVPLVSITEKQIRSTAMKLMTGNTKKDELNINSLTTAFAAIKGQDDILAKLTDLLKRNNLSIFSKQRPLTLLFAGTSGVGKTEVAKIIANELTGVKPIILNMTEYTDESTINRIIGAPPGYVGSDSNAELPFDILESNPYQVILLDEFEKGHRAIQRLFMSIFDEGTLRTNRNKDIDFSRAIIIATTNAGCKEQTTKLGFHTQASNMDTKANIEILSRYFDTELLNRFHTILSFHQLDKDTYKEILINLYEKEITRIKAERPRVQLNASIPNEDLEQLITDSYIPAFGARPAVRTIQKYIEDQLL